MKAMLCAQLLAVRFKLPATHLATQVMLLFEQMHFKAALA